MTQKQLKQNILVLKFDREKLPKCIGAFAPYDDMAVLFAIFEFNGKGKDYKPGEFVRNTDKEVGQPILGLGFQNQSDWDSFVKIVKFYDEKIKKGEVDKCPFGEDSDARVSETSTGVQVVKEKSVSIEDGKAKAHGTRARGTRGKR